MQNQQELAELLLIDQGGETLEEIRKTIGDGRQELTGGRPLEGSRIRVLTIRIAPAQAPFDVVDDTESLGIGQISRGSPVLERANGFQYFPRRVHLGAQLQRSERHERLGRGRFSVQRLYGELTGRGHEFPERRQPLDFPISAQGLEERTAPKVSIANSGANTISCRRRLKPSFCTVVR
jgi:hypothetical protein